MHRHRLSGVLYAAGYAEPTVSAQRMVGGAMRRGAAADVRGIPTGDFIEQAHARPMRNVAFDPAAV
jgi:hypothetical protein